MASTLVGKVLSTLLGLSGRTTVGGGVAGGIVSRILGGVSPDTALDYPKFKHDFGYNVWYIPGPPQFNASYDGNPKPMRMQTLDEHNRALNKYVKPNMTPMERQMAIEKGRAEEKLLESFWTDDHRPRDWRSRSSSSVVKGVKVNPDNTISVQFGGNGKWYTYRGGSNAYETALEAHDLVTSRSLGRSVNPHDPNSWGSRHYNPKYATKPRKV